MSRIQTMRNARMESFEEAILSTITNITQIRTSKRTLVQRLKRAVKLRRSLVNSLQEMKTNKEAYGFGPTQLKALDTLIEKTRKAKSEQDLRDVWRNTCFLKNQSK